MSKVKARWAGARIGFAFMDCPSCKREIKAQYCGALEAELKEPRKMKEQVTNKAVERAKVEGLDKDPRL